MPTLFRIAAIFPLVFLAIFKIRHAFQLLNATVYPLPPKWPHGLYAQTLFGTVIFPYLALSILADLFLAYMLLLKWPPRRGWRWPLALAGSFILNLLLPLMGVGDLQVEVPIAFCATFIIAARFPPNLHLTGQPAEPLPPSPTLARPMQRPHRAPKPLRPKFSLHLATLIILAFLFAENTWLLVFLVGYFADTPGMDAYAIVRAVFYIGLIVVFPLILDLAVAAILLFKWPPKYFGLWLSLAICSSLPNLILPLGGIGLGWLGCLFPPYDPTAVTLLTASIAAEILAIIYLALIISLSRKTKTYRPGFPILPPKPPANP